MKNNALCYFGITSSYFFITPQGIVVAAAYMEHVPDMEHDSFQLSYKRDEYTGMAGGTTKH